MRSAQVKSSPPKSKGLPPALFGRLKECEEHLLLVFRELVSGGESPYEVGGQFLVAPELDHGVRVGRHLGEDDVVHSKHRVADLKINWRGTCYALETAVWPERAGVTLLMRKGEGRQRGFKP